MNTGRKIKKTWNLPIVMFVVFLFCIFLLYMQFAYLSLSTKVYGRNMDSFAESRNTVKKTLKASRGTIYDVSGEVLALNVNSYTVIAYLDEKRSENSSVKLHVEDIDKTAEALATVLETDKDYLKDSVWTKRERNIMTKKLLSKYQKVLKMEK